MPFHYSIPLLPCSQGNDYLAPQLITLDADLVALRQSNPKAYFECFLALFNVSTFSNSLLELVIDDQTFPFKLDQLKKSEFIKPNAETTKIFLQNLTHTVTLAAFEDPYSFSMNEPVRVNDDSYEALEGFIENVSEFIQEKINNEINSIIAEHSHAVTDILSGEDPLNPLLNYGKLINHCPTVDFDQLKAVLAKENFTAHLKSFDAQEKTIAISIKGRTDSIADGILIDLDMVFDEEVNDVINNGYSTVISNVSWDAYNVVRNGKIVDDNFISDITEQLFIDMQLSAVAKIFFIGPVYDALPENMTV
jgi:hypothetical protein